jgi:SAM-dependent methyltransferase
MAEKTAAEWKKDSQSFDRVAELYDRYRPGYPEALFEDLVELAGLQPGSRLLEIGSGTGKATLPLARRGYALHCLEPGANLAGVARQNLQGYPAVTFECARFEDWPDPSSRYDLVFSAQAFHWVPTEVGYAKAARALAPGGALALFWNMYPGMQPGSLMQAIDRAYREIAPDLGSPRSNIDWSIEQRIAEYAACGCYGPVTVRRYAWSQSYPTRDYLGLLDTYSDHLALPDRTRQELCDRIGRAIDLHGGRIERPYLTVLYVARKKE